MKRFFATMIGLVIFSVTPLASSASTALSESKHSKESTVNSSYDLVSSKGYVISYEEYSKELGSRSNFNSKSKKGTGQVLPERNLKKDPNKPTIDTKEWILIRQS
ncbi:hypothetical protein CU633_19785 [Bacillus sp. V3-13]|uniref:hypothetical protein n=1 Tax=Bacillus sp. V3-13 TaxID=2053728 RepID=UPI000C7891F6|nr:hypothetical protein [Bacillus sp. V3-13]PLR75673.1 hypothetical protein CU633_19785 [Bacillus sp. V3-13]